MGHGISVFEKNKLDIDNEDVTITVTDAVATDNGQDSVNQIRNRDNSSGFATTGSTDAAGTKIEIDLVDEAVIDSIFLLQHNFKAYTIKYWNGASFVDFPTAINISGNTDADTFHSVTSTSTSRLELTITETFVADDDKFLAQFVATEKIGQFKEKPRIEPVISKNRKRLKFLSGKERIVRTVGAFECRLRKEQIYTESDLILIERMFDSVQGVLIWLVSGDQAQLRSIRTGYRDQDLFLVTCRNDWEPAFVDGHFDRGITLDMRLIEVA